VRANVKRSLRDFISPLDVSEADQTRDELLGPRWEGWPFGRSLFISELYALIQRAPGVKHVLEVRLGTRPILPGDEPPHSADQMALVPAGQNAPLLEAADAPLTTVKERRLEIAVDTVICSLDHDVQVVTL